MTATALAALVRDVSASLTSYIGAKGLEFPIEAHLVLAYKWPKRPQAGRSASASRRWLELISQGRAKPPAPV